MRKIKIPITAPSLTPGRTNPNGQTVLAATGWPSTTRSGQSIYRLRCTHCQTIYGANGIDAEKRLCPHCQQGAPAEPLRDQLQGPTLFD